MKRSNNILKETIMVIIFLLLSCNNQKSVNYLPINKVYLIEYNYMIVDGWKFQIVGFCELDKNFNLKSMLFRYDSSCYFYSDITVADSLKSKISEIILNYPSDTTFLFKKGSRIYDGTFYRFILEKNNSEKTEIKFIPELLPTDLFFLYKCLYKDKQNSINNNSYENLFKKFENQIKSELYDNY